MSNPVDLPTSVAPLSSEGGRLLEHLAAAVRMVGAGRFRESEIEVLRALSISPADMQSMKLLALVRFKLGRLDDAYALCREMLDARPQDAAIRLKAGVLALKTNRLDQAVRDLETVVRATPGNTRAWGYLGFAYERRGNRISAAAAFRKAGQNEWADDLEGDPIIEVIDPGDGSEGPTVSSEAAAALAAATVVGVLSDDGAESSDFDGPVRLRSPSPWPNDVERPSTAPPSKPTSPLVGTRAIPLSLFATTRLVPAYAPGDGRDSAFSLGTNVRIDVSSGILVRASSVFAFTGTGTWAAVQRLERGRESTRPLGTPESPFLRLAGQGQLMLHTPQEEVSVAPRAHPIPLILEDDVFYVREDRVVAFDAALGWEAGQIPRLGLSFLQFHGRGQVTVLAHHEVLAVKVTAKTPTQMSSRHVLGWWGRLVGQGTVNEDSAAAQPPLDLTCEGDGVVLLDI